MTLIDSALRSAVNDPLLDIILKKKKKKKKDFFIPQKQEMYETKPEDVVCEIFTMFQAGTGNSSKQDLALYDIRGEKGFGLKNCATEVLALLLLVQSLNHLISQSLLFSHL